MRALIPYLHPALSLAASGRLRTQHTNPNPTKPRPKKNTSPTTTGIGDPDLIEIKGVTFCGKSPISTLRMEHVPWHVEVRKFAQAIADRTNGA